jgi:hypothetical protein
MYEGHTIGLLQQYLWTIPSYNDFNEVSLKHFYFCLIRPEFKLFDENRKKEKNSENSKMKGRLCFFEDFVDVM